MASNFGATGEASNAQFNTIYENEFFNNGRESVRLCVTAVNGKPKLNLSKFWFNYQQQQWIPTKQHLYFSMMAWTQFLLKGKELNREIQKLGLSGLLLSFSFTLLSSSFFHSSRYLKQLI